MSEKHEWKRAEETSYTTCCEQYGLVKLVEQLLPKKAHAHMNNLHLSHVLRLRQRPAASTSPYQPRHIDHPV